MMRKAMGIIAGIIALVLVAYAGKILFGMRQTWQSGNRAMGQPLYRELDVNDVARVIIRDKNGFVVLKKNNDIWVVEQERGYPADFDRLRELITAVRDTRIALTRNVRPADYGALELNDPQSDKDGTGTKLMLYDSSGREMVRLILGKPHKSVYDDAYEDGRYLLVENDSVVITRERFPGIIAESKLWLNDTFPRIKLVRRLTALETGKTVWMLERETKQSPMVLKTEMPPFSKLDRELVSQLEHAVAYAKFAEIGDPGADEQSWGFTTRVLEAEGFDGFVYKFTLGSVTGDGRLPAKLEVMKGSGFTESPENEKRLALENRLFHGWVYLLPRATYAPFLMKLNDLLIVEDGALLEDNPEGSE